MADSYVVEGAQLKCVFGSMQTKLLIPQPRYALIDDKKEATIEDYHPNTNIIPFGTCNQGKPTPCQPAISSKWMRGKTEVKIDGVPCLLKCSTLRCQKGGVITIENDGQSDGNSSNNNSNRSSEENKKSKNAVATSTTNSGEGEKAKSNTGNNPSKKEESKSVLVAPDEMGTTDFFYKEEKFTEGIGFEDNDANPAVAYPVVDFLKVCVFGTLSAERYDKKLYVSADINMDVYTTNPNVDKDVYTKAVLSIWDDNGGTKKLQNVAVDSLIRSYEAHLGSPEIKKKVVFGAPPALTKTMKYQFVIPSKSVLETNSSFIILKLRIMASVNCQDVYAIPLTFSKYVASLGFSKAN